MSTIAEIQQAIMSLPKSEYTELRRWLQEYDWKRWDREFEDDVRAGKLDFLAAEALEAKAKGELKDL
jgi:hypothetical protein